MLTLSLLRSCPQPYQPLPSRRYYAQGFSIWPGLCPKYHLITLSVDSQFFWFRNRNIEWIRVMSVSIMLNGSTNSERSFKLLIGEKQPKRLYLSTILAMIYVEAVCSQPRRSSQGSLFEASRNVEIGGGQFSSAQGHHANFTINFNRVSLSSYVPNSLTNF